MNGDPLQPIVFVGLGNPGKKYVHTRHNLGFLVVEKFAQKVGWTLNNNQRFMAKEAKGRLEQKEIHLLLPLTYMNESGKAVKLYLDYYKMTPSHLVVVCDDTALNFGHLRLRLQGSAGGHNGLKSLIACLGTSDFARLRMGIGHRREGQDLADYVLENFSAEESKVLDTIVEQGVAALQTLLRFATTSIGQNIKLTQTPRKGQENT